MFKNIYEFIDAWESSEADVYRRSKLCNHPDFIKLFIDYCKCDLVEWYFSGNNNYCGCTASVGDNLSFLGPVFELAYESDFVKVFTAAHKGFWVPEYIDLKGDDAKEILDILKVKLLEFGGFGEVTK